MQGRGLKDSKQKNESLKMFKLDRSWIEADEEIDPRIGMPDRFVSEKQ